jgi:hypothetical protein
MVKYLNMENFDYKNICSELLANLSGKQKETIVRRFGLKEAQKETLEAIGRDFGVCRERVRQIQSASLDKISLKLEKHNKVFQSFFKHLESFGGLRKESILLEELGGYDNKNEVSFLLSLKEPFKRIHENNDFYSCWVTDESYLDSTKKTISSLFNQLQKIKKPLPVATLKSSLKKKALLSILEASKKIHPNEEGFYGLSSWPEINPKGIKDRAYLVFKKAKKPLHFKEVTKLIEGSHVQTVHNELIKDPRFILVGRGTYALSEWGYYPGQVKDVIFTILKQAPKSLTKEEVLGKVLKQRIVKENTVLLNLNNKNHFSRDAEGKYTAKEI